ncbi:hypothetical protein CSA37_04330 [Candidatus Fermentibacteria bacterium]|nr:MAG: hypothetical protein CSA37_04330 [Candidatus Fermentibacteria bacterium]
MRIAFNIDYHITVLTGIGRYGRELLKAMLELGIQCDVWLARYMRTLIEPDDKILDNASFYPWPRRITDYFWPSREAQRKGITWVHSSNCMLLPEGKGFRQTGMIHDLGPFNYGHMKAKKDTHCWRHRIQQMVKKAHCITVNSTTTRNDLLSIFPQAEGKVFVTPLGIDHFSGSEKRHTGSDHILVVGTVEPRKNIDGLLKAYAELASRRHIPELVIAGKDGFKAEEYKRMPGELGIGERVKFTGYITDSELNKLFARAVCLVHPAHHEGFGFTVPEAFKWGLPVAAARTGGTEEFFTDCIWPADPEKVESISEAMENAIFKGITTEQLAARKKVQQTLTWENCARKTVKALETAENS